MVLKNMQEGFPKPPKKHGDNFIITVRFPRFNSTVFYDPEADILEEALPDEPSHAGLATCASFVPFFAGVLLAFAASKFASF